MSQEAQRGDDPQSARAADPSTSQTELQQLCASRPDLRPLIAENPNAYPQLLEWLGSLNDPEIDAALVRREAGVTPPGQNQQPDVVDDDAAAPGAPGAPTEEFGAVMHPTAEPDFTAQEPASDFDRHIYTAAPVAAESLAGEPYPAYGDYPPQGPAPIYSESEPQSAPSRGGSGCVVLLVLALLTVGALAASYLVFFGNPFTTDEEETAPVEQEEVPEEQEQPAPEEDEQQEDSPPPEESPSPTEDDQTEDPEDELARPAPDDALEVSDFSAPSDNIHCTLTDSEVTCSIDEHFFDAPSGCDGAVTLRVTNQGTAETACDESLSSQSELLDYGQTTGNEDFACEAAEEYFECWSQQSGNGFQLAREFYELYEY